MAGFGVQKTACLYGIVTRESERLDHQVCARERDAYIQVVSGRFSLSDALHLDVIEANKDSSVFNLK